MDAIFRVAPEVEQALAAGAPVVALETSVVAQGLPAPANLEAARACSAAVRSAGAVPAFVALLDGRVVVGAGEAELERLANPASQTAKAGARDLGPLLAARRPAGTTVSATCAVAERVGIRVFATGGIGGVHRVGPDERGAARDVSADLAELAARGVCVVAAGPKVILDVEATAEALETLGVLVVGWRTGELPAFHVASSGIPLEHRVETAEEAARTLRLHWAVAGGARGALLCVAPPEPLPSARVEAALRSALAEARAGGVRGKALTPFLLEALRRGTGGASVAANVALLRENARVAGEVAAALARELA